MDLSTFTNSLLSLSIIFFKLKIYILIKFYQVLRSVVPLCLGQYSTKTTTADKIRLMDTLNSFITISRDHGFRISDIPELTWTDIPNLYLNELNEGEKIVKSKALIGLSIQVSSLSDTHRGNLYDRLCLEIDNGDQELKNSTHSTLLIYARRHPKEIQDILQDRLKIDINVPKQILENRLEALSSISKIPDLAPEILPSILKIAISEEPQSSAALSCLQTLLITENPEFDIHNYLENDCRAIGSLIESVDKDFERMRLVSNICCSIVRKLSPAAQEIVMEKHFSNLRSKIAEDIVLLEGIITPLASEIVKAISIEVLGQFFEIGLKSTEGETQASACRLVSILVNKIGEGEILGRHLNIFRETLSQVIEAESSFEEKKAAVVMHTWLTKSLVIRGSKESQDFLDYQMNMLKNEDIGEFAGEQFKSLVDRNERTLTEENSCTVKIFYKQRVFQNVIRWNGMFEEGARQNYLIALSHLVEESPVELLSVQLAKVCSIECIIWEFTGIGDINKFFLEFLILFQACIVEKLVLKFQGKSLRILNDN